MTRQPSSETTAQRFGRVIADAARRAGYDIDTPRGGGKSALAKATGMHPANVGRMLEGTSLPHPTTYEALAKAVDLPLRDLLVESGIISPESLSESDRSRVASSTTPEGAAVALGFVEGTVDYEMFLAMVARIRSSRPTGPAPVDEQGGAAAEG